LSPVFRHGSLRLYLLRLLDEEPRHGYEVIRLLRDRFMGVYSPSPGTIYPRLARLEEEGLVTHDEVDGRKVYRITEAGREELRSRSEELDELEEELSASVSDIVREVREDVRQTVRSLREELTWAARESRRATRDSGADVREQARQAREDAREHARQAKEDAREHAREHARRIRDQLRDQVRQASEGVREQARQAREQAEQAREESRGHWGPGDWMREEAGTRFHPGDQDWDAPPGWAGRRAWEDWARMRGRHGWTGPLDFGTFRDLERLAVQFTSDLRRLAMQSSVVGENVISDLRVILEEALERIKSDIFGPAAPGRRDSAPEGTGSPEGPGGSAAPGGSAGPGTPQAPRPPGTPEKPEAPEPPEAPAG